MPVYELGYRHWEGERTKPWLRWTAISRVGISLAFRSKILRRLVFFAWAPLLYFGPLFFAIGFLTDSSNDFNGRTEAFQFARGFLGKDLAAKLQHEPESVRPVVWSVAFQRFIAVPQGLLMILLVAIAGAPLIAQDVGSKAFLIYFSKPITRWEYLLGKSGTVLFFIFLVTLFPALVLYAVSIAVSPSFRAIADTGMTVPRILASSLVVAIPSTFVILCLSSFARESRYVAFAWVTIWVMGQISFWVLRSVPELAEAKWLCLIAPWECLNVVTGAIFNVDGQLHALGVTTLKGRGLKMLLSSYSPTLAASWLAAVSVFCLALVTRRVSAPMRI